VADGDSGLSATTIQVLEVFLDVPDKRYYSIEIARRVGAPVEAIYPDLVRLVSVGWIRTSLNALPSPGSRCRRRWYQLTAEGRGAADRQPAPRRLRRRDDRAGWWRRRRVAAALLLLLLAATAVAGPVAADPTRQVPPGQRRPHLAVPSPGPACQPWPGACLTGTAG
jgi:hypothetical protein